MISRARRRLLIGNVLVLLVLAAAMAATIAAVAVRLLDDDAHSRLAADADLAAVDLRSVGDADFAVEHASTASGTFYLLWDAGGAASYDPAHVASPSLQQLAASARGGTPQVTRVHLASGAALVDSRVVALPGGGNVVLETGRSLEPVETAQHRIILAAVIIGAAAAALSLAAAWWLTHRALHPIGAAMAREQRLLSDASHELRTPLAHADAALQVLRRHPDRLIGEESALLDAVADEMARMHRLTSDLLYRARSEHISPRRESVDVDATIKSVIAAASPRADENGHTLAAGTLAAGTANADGDQVRQMVVALVDNSITHTPDGTAVTVEARRESDTVIIEVADDGPGIPSDEASVALEPFARLSAGRASEGAGLGLTIVSAIARAHGGKLELLDNRPGLRARVTLADLSSQ